MKFRLFIFLVIFCFSPAKSLFALDQEIENSFFAHAEEIQQKGRVLESINDYCRALLLNPNHSKARKKLLELVNHPVLTSDNKSKIISVNDLLVFNDTLLKRQQYFLDKISEFKAYLIKLGMNKIDLDEVVIISKNESDLSKFPKNSSDPLAVLSLKLSNDRNYLTQKIDILEQQMISLRAYSKLNSKVANPVNAPSAKISSTKTSIVSSSQQFQSLKDELDFLKHQINVLESKLEDKDQKLFMMNNQIVNLSLEFSQKELLLNQKLESLGNLDEGVSDLRSRFDLGQKIIKEKDSQLAKIQEKVNVLENVVQKQKDDFDQLLAVKDQNLFEITGILEIYQGKLFDVTTLARKQEATISTLEDQINLIQYKAFQSQSSLLNPSDSLEPLRQELAELENTIKNPTLNESSLQLADLLEHVLLLKNQIKKLDSSL